MSTREYQPKFRLFAGPNGSGKSTLINEIKSKVNIGYFINADVIEDDLKKDRSLQILSYLPNVISQIDWLEYCEKYKDDTFLSRFTPHLIQISADGSQLVCNSEINSYQASFIAAFLRDKLASTKQGFSFETVMSHQSKVDFLDKMRSKGYKTYLYFICTIDPQINVERVLKRVIKGGHNVDNKKIVDRYYRSLSPLELAFKSADRAYVIDSTTLKNSIILEKKYDQLIFHNDNVPQWVEKYLLNSLSGKG